MLREPSQREPGRRGRKVKARVRKALIGGSIPPAAYYTTAPTPFEFCSPFFSLYPTPATSDGHQMRQD